VVVAKEVTVVELDWLVVVWKEVEVLVALAVVL
jgi:hypothetical protein